MFEVRPQKCGFYFRRKDRWELTKISAAVMGIEFAYAAETAFVSPTLLKIGKLFYISIIYSLVFQTYHEFFRGTLEFQLQDVSLPLSPRSPETF